MVLAEEIGNQVLLSRRHFRDNSNRAERAGSQAALSPRRDAPTPLCRCLFECGALFHCLNARRGRDPVQVARTKAFAPQQFLSLGNTSLETGAEGCLDALVGVSLLQRLSGFLAHGLSGDFSDINGPFVMGPGWSQFGGFAPPRAAVGPPREGATFEAIALRRRPEPIRGCIVESIENPASPG